MKRDGTTMKRHRNSSIKRRGFTLIEVIIAAVVTAFLLGSMAMSISGLGRSKSTSKQRLDAYLRADAALTSLRREIIALIRTDDLFYTRFHLIDDSVNAGPDVGHLDRDELLIYNNRLASNHDIDFQGEGSEYETQLRVEDDDFGPALWQRRDPVPEEFPFGGGMVIPVAEGVIALNIEVFDGNLWNDDWESDDWGIPHAVRLTVTASGHRGPDDIYTAPWATLRTVVPIDRSMMSQDMFLLLNMPELPTDDPGAGEDPNTAGGAGGGGGGTNDVTGGGGGGGGIRPPGGGGGGGNDVIGGGG